MFQLAYLDTHNTFSRQPYIALLHLSHSQLVLGMSLLTGIFHSHDLDNKTGPSSEVLCSLPGTRVGVVLLPSEACFFPTLVHGVNKVLTKTRE
jgi:hypothetical protein